MLRERLYLPSLSSCKRAGFLGSLVVGHLSARAQMPTEEHKTRPPLEARPQSEFLCLLKKALTHSLGRIPVPFFFFELGT